MHNYVNTTNENDNQFEYCRALYPFLAIDDTTLTVNEGDNFKIIQKHDDNGNNEWWLLEKLQKQNDESKMQGYVPSNYVELIYAANLSNMNANEIAIDTLECPILS